MKMSLRCKPGFYVLFSNVGSKDKNEFYVVIMFHEGRQVGFGEGITVEEAEKTLKKENDKYRLVEPPL